MRKAAKRGPGRPPVDRPTGRRITVYLLPDVEQRATEIGGGVLSRGITEAVRAFKQRRSSSASGSDK